MTKRTKSEILPTLKVKVEADDNNAVAFEPMQVILKEIKDISTIHGEKTLIVVERSDSDEKMQVFLNVTSQNALIDAFGEDDKRWIGKICDLELQKDDKYKKEMIVFIPVK